MGESVKVGKIRSGFGVGLGDFTEEFVETALINPELGNVEVLLFAEPIDG
jgi:hypothetical protein